jgi:hypothetical protein
MSVTDRRLAFLVGSALLFLCCSLPWVGLWNPNGVADTGLYGLYGTRMAHGLVPYRDYFMEFPPGAIPALVLPALPGSHYVVWFKIFEFVCAIGTMACLVEILGRIGATGARLYGAVAVAGVAPLALGKIALNSFDYWPALLTAGAVAVLVAGRRALGFALLGLATAAKLFPAGLLLLALLFTVRRHGPRSWRSSLAVYVAATALVFAPFAALAPGGLRFSLQTQLERGLQLESLGASLLATAHRLGAYRPSFASNLAYAQLAGHFASVVATLSTVVMVFAILLVAWLYHRTSGGDGDFVYAVAATVAGIVTFAKVLSPQYLIWLIPLVAAAVPRTRAAGAVLLVALGLTHVWVPTRFRELQRMDWVTWVLLARNLVLVSLVALLALGLRARAASAVRAADRTERGGSRPSRRRARPARGGRTA